LKTLLSLPPNLLDSFYQLEKVNTDNYFCSSDPIGTKLGSGGGTTWLLDACKKKENDTRPFSEWISKEKRILLHAGGQSRRLPAYAPSGKVLTPIPVFDSERGQRLGQNLLSLQLPLYEEILKKTPGKTHTLIASGDVYIRTDKLLQDIPDVDIVCYGLWTNPALATNHGVFVMKRSNPEDLDYMLQKPNIETLETLSKTHLYLMDIGIWLLSDRAMEVLRNHSYSNASKEIGYYDLYSEYGLALGKHPQIADAELNKLSVAILPLQGGEFYHYGTSKELLSSTLTIQNKECDQRKIMHHKVKPNPAIFVQNAITDFTFSNKNENIWIENSYIGKNWKLGSCQIITCVPPNNWDISLPDNICIDVVPIAKKGFAARPYGFFDMFKGNVSNEKTLYLNKSITTWLEERSIKLVELEGNTSDLQSTRLFPVTESIEELELLFRWMISEPDLEEGKELWIKSEKLSADELSNQANLSRLYAQRESYRKDNWTGLAKNYEKSIFYQLDLADAAQEYSRLNLPIPDILDENASPMTKIHNRMLRSYIYQLKGDRAAIKEQETAFGLLREGLMGELSGKDSTPHMNVYSDQIVWGRCPVRIDVAGGWTDTPPYSLYAGGNVVNFAIELNGQPPLQVYIKPTTAKHILLRSIDMGATEIVSTYEELRDYKKVGSPFSIPKAALILAGFSPLVAFKRYATLEDQLKDFGAGIEITLLAAIPAGSGLGTSSILASTVLGALNDFCGLEWDKNEICKRTLVLEQLLTTGGGWQDQYGGVLQGIKLLQSDSGFNQNPLARWLPTDLFTSSEYKDCHLLYYTGITRTAKNILEEIVRSMFLNSSYHLRLLSEMKHHALCMNEAILKNDFNEYGKLVYQTWQQNKQLDRGTNPPAIEALINQIKDYCLGYKLPGAGGGGYLYMVAKDPQAAQQIKKILSEHAPNERARFVNMTLSNKGFQVSRS